MHRFTIPASLIALAFLHPHAQAEAKGTEKQRYTHPACQDDSSQCGGIIYGVDGAYVVNPVEVISLSSIPSGVAKNSHCSGWEATFSNGLDLGQYDTFVVPGPCEYHLKIQIQLGNKKDKKFYLIPGCQIESRTDGTTLSNSWHVKAEWSNKAKKDAEDKGVTLSGTPQDADGNHCGTLGNL